MRISRLRIENFRNFKEIDIKLDQHAVILGENTVGKSNLLHAFRLVLDPSLPESARSLREEDFWDGLTDPIKTGARIAITVELADFDQNEDHWKVLNGTFLQGEPVVAQLTFAFEPKRGLKEAPKTEGDYAPVFYGAGDLDTPAKAEIRRRLPLDVLNALRDAENDIANWRKSPLRELLEDVEKRLDPDDLAEVSASLIAANEALSALGPVEDLSGALEERLTEMMGSQHAIDPRLQSGPLDPNKLIRRLRLYFDEGLRTIGEASLGTANTVYLALKQLEIELNIKRRNRYHTFLAIEEPEAHLYPHLQRLVYRDLLNRKGDARELSLLVTTHSPHIASVAPLRSLVLLRHDPTLGATTAVSAAEIALGPDEVEDIERYLDVTRAEILFAKAVILVEGDAERFLLPSIAEKLGVRLDEHGISICAIQGTHFTPYARFLGALGIPFVILTDTDPKPGTQPRGKNRVLNLISVMHPQAALTDAEKTDWVATGAKYGIFVSGHTLEVDLAGSDLAPHLFETMIELADSNPARERAQAWRAKTQPVDHSQLLVDLDDIGKGRAARRLAVKIGAQQPPTYIATAISHAASSTKP